MPHHHLRAEIEPRLRNYLACDLECNGAGRSQSFPELHSCDSAREGLYLLMDLNAAAGRFKRPPLPPLLPEPLVSAFR